MSRLLLTLLVILLGKTGLAADPAVGHWSLTPPPRPTIPKSGVVPPRIHPIDAFVEHVLQQHDLSLSPEADRRTLIRRLSLNVLGLPPTPSEISDFVRDARPDAYERLVDRLLGSPHYGEHLAPMWLDVVRFTESQGFERDKPRDFGWLYRDYVVRSFNHDKPYDRFVMEQVAGDLLPDAGADGIIATGFLVCGPYDEVGHSSASESVRLRTREDELEDIVSTVTQTFIGLTVNCARCHDHKYDPIPQRDYYRIRSVFDAIRPGDRGVIPEAEREARRERMAQIDAEIAQIHREREVLARKCRGRNRRGEPQELPQVEPTPIARWTFENDARDQIGSLHGKLHGTARIERGRLILDGAGSYVETEPLPRDLREKSFEAWVVVSNRSQRGGAVVSVITQQGQVFDALVFGEMQAGRWMAGSDFFRRSREHDGEVESSAPSDLIHLVVTYGKDGQIAMFRNGRPYFAPYVPADPGSRQVTFRATESRVLFGLRHPGSANGFLQGEIDEVRLYDRALTTADVEALYRRGPWARFSINGIGAARSDEHRDWDELEQRLSRLRREYEEIRQEPTAYAAIVRSAPAARILSRGDPSQPREVVSPGAVSAIRSVSPDFGLPPDSPEGERRLAFARWLVHPDHPLTARVMVNRLWRWCFGTGLVETPNDFGAQGDRPSNQALLDWLATEFQQSGWSIKHIHRLILTSATYRQSSMGNDRAAAIDPENRLLWRYPARRVDAETIRDSMLAVSGQLNRQVGGASFRPFRIRVFNSTFYELLDEERSEWNRRSIYRMHIQSAKDPILECMDKAEPSVRTPKRVVTATPVQALSLMNSRFVNTQAWAFAQRIAAAADPIAEAYELAYGRLPSSKERSRAEQLRREAGWLAVCWALFNSSEFLYLR